MELDDMQSIWQDMDARLSGKTGPSDAEILRMARRKSRAGLRRIMVAEGVGIGLVLAMMGYLAMGLPKLEDPLAWSAAAVLMGVLAASAAMGAAIIRQAQRIDIAQESCAQTQARFERFKRLLSQYKRFSIPANLLLLLAMPPVAYPLLLDKPLVLNAPLAALWAGGVLLTGLLLWGIIALYTRQVRQVGRALSDAEGTPPENGCGSPSSR